MPWMGLVEPNYNHQMCAIVHVERIFKTLSNSDYFTFAYNFSCLKFILRFLRFLSLIL